MNDLLSRNKMPIIVGGTNYYIESLLWKVLVDSTSTTQLKHSMKRKFDYNESDSDGQRHVINSFTKEQMNTIESKLLHEYLRHIDPVTANKLHPNNKRRIIRAIEIYNASGKLMSSVLHEQRTQDGGSNLGGPLRYKNILLFWLHCEQEVLNKRLDARVDSMVESGLLDEIREFHENFVKPYGDRDYTKGILQTIGFKEFIPYLEKFDSDEDKMISLIMKNKETSGEIPESLNLLNECLDQLKLATIRYSKNQNKWVKNRFLGNLRRDVPPLYKLDTTDPSKWQEDIFERAVEIIQAFIEDRPSKIEPEKRIPGSKDEYSDETTNMCIICDRVFIGEYQWRIHNKSNKHKKILSKKKQFIE
ncbi:tRNA dimethylallyltransferase [Sergentomyia squamirostris]